MQTKHVIYAGSFDPPTCGHLHIIHKACKIFDKVTVLVSDDPNKKCMFGADKRLSMVTEMIAGIPNATASILPPHQYVASYAKQNDAQFLVRGIRDSMDYNAEQKMCRTNKEIEGEIETIYLRMPDDFYSIVSSSWVKSMVGYTGWREILQDKVSPGVLKVLKAGYLLERWRKVTSRYLPEEHVNIAYIDKVLEAYGSRTYHNLDHLIDCLETLDKNTTMEIMKDYNDIVLALFFHDFHSDEESSCAEAPSRIWNLIMATKHSKPEYCKTEAEKFIASIDLAILGSVWGKYQEYMKNVAKEYFPEGIDSPVYRKNRIVFLQTMLNRTCIFPYASVGRSLEYLARHNIGKEIAILSGMK